MKKTLFKLSAVLVLILGAVALHTVASMEQGDATFLDSLTACAWFALSIIPAHILSPWR